MAFFLSLLLGFAPMLLYAGVVYWIDRYEKEPWPLVIGLFAWGAIFAAGASFLLNTLFGIGVYLFTESEQTTQLATGIFSAPLVEETSKGLAILLVWLWFRSEFDTYLDGIVYGALIGLGFAATENTYYIYSLGYLEQGWNGLAIVSLIRILLFGLQHAYYTSFTGLGLAAARLSRRPAVRWLAPFAGLAMAMLTHAFHNTLLPVIGGLEGLAVVTAADWIGWAAMGGVILWAIRREKSWILTYLAPEVELGTLTQAQLQVAASPASQTAARISALFQGKWKPVSAFFQACAELAWKKHQARTAGGAKADQRIDQLRSEVRTLSPLAG